MTAGDNDLTAAFRAKAIFMKSWKPASAPSVRIVSYIVASKLLSSSVLGVQHTVRRAIDYVLTVATSNYVYSTACDEPFD
jgi:hypothetical protein